MKRFFLIFFCLFFLFSVSSFATSEPTEPTVDYTVSSSEPTTDIPQEPVEPAEPAEPDYSEPSINVDLSILENGLNTLNTNFDKVLPFLNYLSGFLQFVLVLIVTYFSYKFFRIFI